MFETGKGKKSDNAQINTIQLTDIFELEEIQYLQDSFSDAHGVASVITTTKGIPLTRPSNFSHLCEKVIRGTELGRKYCFESGTAIGKQNKKGPTVHSCLACGLWDAGVSIVVGDRHIGNWFIGQIRNEPVNTTRLIKYADEIGASREEFLAAYYRIPEMPVENFKKIANLLFVFANQFSEKAYALLQLKIQTKEKESATLLQIESETKFSKVFYEHQTPMLIVDLNTKKHIDHNTSFVKLFELNNESLEVEKFLEHLPWIKTSEKKQEFTKIQKESILSDYSIEYRTRLGKIINLRLFASFIETKKNNLAIISVYDNTLNCNQLKELSLNNERLEALLHILQSKNLNSKELLDFTLERAIYLTESKIGYLYYYNEESNQFTLNTWPGKAMDECGVIDPETLYNLESTGCWGEAVRQRKPFIANNYSLENKFVKGTSKGHVSLKKFLTVPIISDKQIKAVIGVANKEIDYSERDIKKLQLLMDAVWKEVENRRYQNDLLTAKIKAEESDRLKSAFLSNMSHEIRTPMNGILGFIDLLEDPDLSVEEQKHFFGIVRKSSARLLNTITDIVEIAKIESGQNDIFNAKENLGEIMAYHYAFFLPEAKSRELSFDLDNHFAHVNMITDRTKLDSILTNLIKNALKFTKQGSVCFGCKLEKNNILFYVKDTGIGIAEERKDGIFNRFEQADLGINRGYEGSGLGLSIAKAYSEMLGGKIWVESQKNIGSTFYFTIKYKAVEGENKMGNSEDFNKVEKNEGKIILVAEDDITSFKFMEVILKGSNYKLLHAENGLEALHIFEENRNIDLILMDIKMPVLDGIEATQRIREIDPAIPIIAQTAYALSGDKEIALNAGCTDYVTKPLNRSNLLLKIKENLAR